ncbi:MAG: hypothetical protein HYT48_02275 [Candidatus Vogelbacteria bacterium]|nr:hypothetical protein [Candidatus Vogelbacteria bacterium]
MPTIKSRINITADRAMKRALTQAAKREQVPVATKAAALLRLALELEEDQFFGALAEERLKDKKAKYLSHEEFWRRALSH